MYPQYRHLVAKDGTKLGLVVLSSDIPPTICPQYRHLVAKGGTKLGPIDLSSDIPPSPW